MFYHQVNIVFNNIYITLHLCVSILFLHFFLEIFEQLKPELIAPVVVWLCHEKCMENGSIIESALGWAGKCKCRRNCTDCGKSKLYFSNCK